MNFESGEFFDLYKVGEKLGHGHFAEVKHCIDKINHTEYAAKFIRVRQLLDSKNAGMNLDEIEREAHILKMLNHQNIIKLFFCYDLGKNVALVLELVSGGELFDHISDSERLSEEEASEFIEQILLGVQHMHERKVVHLDLKPENVMIEDLEERKIKLIDFGLAREIKKQDTIIEMQGTSEFLAPEVINYDPISYATDMWAIGVISYIMLTGVSPFSGDDQFSTFQNIINCRLDFDEDVCSDMSEMAKNFINSLLVLNPRERATANSCFKHPWIKPMEQASVFRRRSSIISRDKLQLLKQFVVYPSPPGSEAVTPQMIRKYQKKNELLEDVEDGECDLINLDSKTTDAFENNSCQSNNNANNANSNHSKTGAKISIEVENYIDSSNVYNGDIKNNSVSERFEGRNCINDTSPSPQTAGDGKSNLIRNYQSDYKKPELSLIENSLIEESSCRMYDVSLSQDSSSTSQSSECMPPQQLDSIIIENSFKQKFNNTISNSVKRLNVKFESITSIFDSKNKTNSSPITTKRRSSLKNLLNISSGASTSDKNKQLFSALSTDRSISYDGTLKFNSKPVSTSVATSPTIMKKSVFVSRYMAHIDSKKT